MIGRPVASGGVDIVLLAVWRSSTGHPFPFFIMPADHVPLPCLFFPGAPQHPCSLCVGSFHSIVSFNTFR